MRIRTLGVALTFLALVAAGCGANEGSGSAPPPEPVASTPVEPAPPETPEPLSKDAYQKLLTGSESTIRKAFDQVMAAKSLAQVKSGADALDAVLAKQSQTFEATLPPDSAADAHSTAATLLSQSQVGFEPSKAEANECGIKPNDTEQLIQAKQQVHDTLPGELLKETAGDFKRAGFTWGGKLLPARPETPKGKKRRADNGEIVERNGSRGYNLLQIKNDTKEDVVIAAVTKNPKKPMASIYVRAGKDATLEGLAAKKYTVYYKSGTDWDDDKRTFTRSCAFSKFRQSFTPESNWSIELQPRLGGNAPTDDTEPF
ncbi:hypothetical protein [Microlunatus speluncae]|uniref:hypothetical protein n=1 Tax=Microlunatus speluncae TaxID=2594267 RepID=UPI0012664292|nr:hypothetical protein [Microlunatus speluncae]